MAGSFPASLMTADISRFAQRAAQVEKAKPVVAYWCYYWIVNQILSRGLHNTDEESLNYTTGLMDKLEQTKADNADNDAIMDDLAGQAYIEQFGLETFQRADNAVKANKASRQTADTFQASATFLDLAHIWGPLDSEIASKIKYAKYHALRIANAIKAGEDPNLSNPKAEVSPERETLPKDFTQSEVHIANGASTDDRRLRDLRQPSVEDIPDDYERLQRSLAQHSTLDESLHPSRAPSVPRPPLPNPSTADSVSPAEQNNGEDYYMTGALGGNVSPLQSSSIGRKGSDGGGYFPRVPEFHKGADVTHRPTAPPDESHLPIDYAMPDPTLHPPSPTAPETGASGILPTDAFHSIASPAVEHSSTSSQPRSDLRSYQPQQPTVIPHLLNSNISSDYKRQPRSRPQPTISPQHNSNQVIVREEFVADEEAIMKAQKHARWAISALNFEDVKTAVKELRGALEVLGAQ